MNNNELWGLLVVGGPVLLGLVLLWATLNNKRSRAEVQRTERATAQLYEEQDRIDKAMEHASDAPETSEPRSAKQSIDTQPPTENLSTLNQEPGDARRPSDTLDRNDRAIPAKDWQPGRDEGRSRPVATSSDDRPDRPVKRQA
jgi:hypothetical protein